MTEPAGALALAGLKRYILKNNLVGAQKKLVAVISGANMNFDRLRFVAERAELGEGREALLSVDIPEKPGRYVFFFYGTDPGFSYRSSNPQLRRPAFSDTPTCSHRIHIPLQHLRGW